MKRILWFRRDLRAHDNPILSIGGEVLPIFIFDTKITSKLDPHDKRIPFIFKAVCKLKEKLREKGLDLKVFAGDPEEVFRTLESKGFDEVVASGDFDAYATERDIRVSLIMEFRRVKDTYIFDPDEMLKEDGNPYQVFTPFYNKAKAILSQEHMKEHPFAEHTLSDWDFEGITSIKKGKPHSMKMELRSLGFKDTMEGENRDAEAKLGGFLKKLNIYSNGRDILGEENTSRLSTELRFGTISIREILRALAGEESKGAQTEPFLRQLIFRDFYAHMLHHFPELAEKNHKKSFEGEPDEARLKAFREGRTGVPIVDAGIRELLETGNMHNRARMVCASFFTKHLLLPWKEGERFFAEKLMDYDAASNILSWQWSAGTGIDPQPYFRVFNPWLQSKKFDKEAEYIKKWLKELQEVDTKDIHSETFFLENDIKGYPKPIVDHKTASKKAIEAFKN